jgi:hypothetical protein
MTTKEIIDEIKNKYKDKEEKEKKAIAVASSNDLTPQKEKASEAVNLGPKKPFVCKGC